MIEKAAIGLSKDFINGLQTNSKSRHELILEEVLSHSKAVEDLLSGYYYDSRGKVYGLDFKKESLVFEGPLQGSLTVHYSIGYFMGCQDITYDDHGTMRIDFEISIQEKIMRLKGENIHEREPDTY